MIEAALILGGLLLSTLAFWIGAQVGRQSVVNQLLDATNPELWNAAHYVRADEKANDKA